MLFAIEEAVSRSVIADQLACAIGLIHFVLEVVPDRNLESTEKLWKTLTKEQQSKIKAVASNRSKALLEASLISITTEREFYSSAANSISH